MITFCSVWKNRSNEGENKKTLFSLPPRRSCYKLGFSRVGTRIIWLLKIHTYSYVYTYTSGNYFDENYTVKFWATTATLLSGSTY